MERVTIQTLAKIYSRTHKGFTLVEMTVVITILVVMFAAIMPNLLSESRSREARQFFSKARNLMMDARSRAVREGQTRSVRIDESAGRLIVETTDPETGDVTEGASLELPEGVTGNAYRIELQESNSAEWTLRFYGDGRARKGGISFSSNGRIISLSVDERGTVTQIDGPLPDTSEDSWDAGGYEQRI